MWFRRRRPEATEIRPWRPCPFAAGRAYRVVRDTPALRDAFAAGERLTFERDVWSRYHGYTGYLFRDAAGALRVYDVADDEPGDGWAGFVTPADRPEPPPHGEAPFWISQEPGNVSTVDYGRLHGWVYDRDIARCPEGTHAPSPRAYCVELPRFAGPLLVTLSAEEHARCAALGLTTRPVKPPWCEDAASDARLAVTPDGAGGWRVGYGRFLARVPGGALHLGEAGGRAYLVIEAVAEPVRVWLEPGA